MSKTIDERIVSMQFDNKHFESNVQTSLGTLDKLKQSLKLEDASKGLENVNAAAKKIDMSGLSNGVEEVKVKFSALQVIGITALQNITNQALAAGQKIVSALTIDPIKTGFQEYETQMNAVQTILANTQSKGSTLDDVNKALDTLNEYADKTIYNFTEMTRNIGTFTAAGVDLQTSVDSIQGIANLAAVSGSSSQQASTAMYQLSQALAAGKVSLMDWNSVVNAGMGGELFQNALIRTSELMDTGAKKAIKSYGSFRESLSKTGWLTKEVLTETLKQISGAYSESELIAQGYTKKQAKEIVNLAETATNAATKVKTFTQLWDVMKESAQSGWSQSWKIIVGDFEEAKTLLTPLADYFTGIIGKISDFRNTVLAGAMGLKDLWSGITDKLSTSGVGKIAKVADAVANVSHNLKYYQDVVNKVWRGDYNNRGDNPDRKDLLEKAGYNYRVIQDLVNKGYKYKLTMEDVEASHKKFGVTMTKTTENTKDVTKALGKLTDKQLKNAGLTENEISLYKALVKEADRLDISLDELIKDMSKNDGRTLLIESIKNAWDGISGVFNSIKRAFAEIFNPPGAGELAIKLYGIIKSLNKFSESLRLTDKKTGELTDTAKNLQRTFKGVFAAIDIVLTILGGPLKIIFKFVRQLLGYFNIDVLGVTASIGDAIVKFRDWIDSVLDFTKVFDVIAPYIKKATKAVGEWFASFKESKTFKTIVSYLTAAKDAVVAWFVSLKDAGLFKDFVDLLGRAGKAIGKWFEGLKTADNIPAYIISGLINGLAAGISSVVQFVFDIGIKILDTIKKVLGIHSPSTQFFDIGKNIIQGLVNGISEGLGVLWDLVMSIGNKLIEIIRGLDIGSIFTIGVGAGMTFGFVKIAKAFDAFVGPMEHISGILYNAKRVVGAFKGVVKSFSLGIKAEAIKSIAIAIAILAGSIAVLSLLDPGKVWSAVGAIAVLMGLLAGLTFVVGKFGPAQGVEFGKVALMLLGMGAAMLLISFALKNVAAIDPDRMGQVIDGFATIVLAIIGSVLALSKSGPGINAAGSTFLKLAAAILVMTYVAKIIGNMKPEQLKTGLIGIVAFSAIIVGLMAATKLISGSKNVDSIGGTILKIAGALLVMVLVAKIAGSMKASEMEKGMFAIVAFSAIIVGLMAATKLITGSTNVGKIGGAIFGIAGALLLMVFVAKIAASMKPSDLERGIVAIVAFSGIIVGLMAATKLISGSKNMDKIGKTLLMLTVSIGLLALVAVLLSLIETKNLIKGVAAVAVLAVVMMGLIYVTKQAKNCTGTLVALTVAIGVLALAVGLLSMIDGSNLASATIAIGVLLGMFALVIKATGNVKKSFGTLIVLTAAIVVLAGVLWLLAQLPVESAVGSSIALSALLLAMSGAMLLLSKMKTNMKNVLLGVVGLLAICVPLLALVGILYLMQGIKDAAGNALVLAGFATVLTLLLIPLALVGMIYSSTNGMAMLGIVGLLAMCVPLLALVGILALMQGIQNAAENASILAGFATVLTLLLIPLALVGVIYTATGGMAMLGLVGLLAMCIPVLALVGILALMQGIKDAEANANLLINLMTALTKILVVLAIVGPLALIGVVAMGALVVLMGVVGALAIAIGALMELCPDLKKFLDVGIPIMVQLAGGIGEMIGAFIGGVAEQIAASLPAIGTSLSEFMNNAQPFIDGVRKVDDAVLKGVGIMAGAVALLVAVDFLENIASFLGGGTSFSTLGTELSNFMTNAQPFVAAISSVKPEIMDGVKALTDAILMLTGANLLNQIASFLGGDNSLATFGTQLGDLGTNLKTFVTNLGTFTDEQVTSATCAAKVIKALAEAAKAVPASGGIFASIFGEGSLAEFGASMPDVATNITAFVTNLGTFTDEQVKTAECAAKTIKALADAAQKIPATGSIFASIFGEGSLADFAGSMPDVATNLKTFVTNLGTFTDEQVKTADCAGRAIKALADAGKNIPASGGFFSGIFGDNSLATFGENMPDLGKNIKTFVTNLGKFSDEQVQTVDSASAAIISFAKLGKANIGDLNSKLPDFGKKIVEFAEKLSTFVTTMGKLGASQIKVNIQKTNDLINLAKTAAGTNVKSLSTFGDSLAKVATKGVTGFVGAFTGEDPAAKVQQAASTMLDNFTKAAGDKTDDVKKKFEAIADAGADNLSTKTVKSTATSAGKDLVNGFADGITAQTFKAEAKAAAMASAALKAAKEALDENSPSKEMYKIGSFAGQGFVNAFDDYRSIAGKAGAKLAKSSVDGLKGAIYKISDIISSDIDTQPTIRPVLDLSDVRSGASSINGMFSGRTLSVNARTVGAISASMANYQNGRNSSDVVSAINGLRKDISDMPRNTYSIGGITYDDGSNIADAVSSLVRAARIERRV